MPKYKNYSIEDAQKEQDRVNKKMERELSKFDKLYQVNVGEQIQGIDQPPRLVGEIRGMKKAAPRYTADVSEMSQERRNEYVRNLKKASKFKLAELEDNYRNNLISAVQKVFGSDGDEMVDILTELSIEDFRKIRHVVSTVSFDFIYDEVEFAAKLEELFQATETIQEILGE